MAKESSSVERIIDFEGRNEVLGLIVSANGGSLTITAKNGETFEPVTVITASSSQLIETGGAVLKFTPAGGATYTV